MITKFWALSRMRQWVGNLLFSLFFLTVMLDPTNTVLALKSKLFAFLLVYNIVFFRPSLRFLPHILLVYVGVTICYLLSLIQGNGIDQEAVLNTYLAFSPLFLLLWVHHYDLMCLSLFPACMVAVVVVLIFGFSSYDESFEGAIYYFMKAHDDMVMMTHRYLLGVKVFGIYYKSFACLCLPLFWFYYVFYKGGRKAWLLFLPTAILTFAFFLSGTRATMLFPFFLIALVSYRRLMGMRRARYFFYPLLVVFSLTFLALVVLLASEKGEASNVIKYGHLISYWQLFEDHPLYLLLGQGPGTRFFSAGFHRLTLTTEWTYLELLRQYGIFCILILLTMLYPLAALWRHREQSFVVGVMGAYVAYLLIAGTNPLLVSSTGMQILLVAYSVVCKVNAIDEKPSERISG